MKRLLKDYEKTLKLISDELTKTINEATDMNRVISLTIKRSCYKTFIKDLKEFMPPDAPISTKPTAEDIREEEERAAKQKKMDDEHDAFIARLMADDEPEIKKPKGFEDFEPSTGK